MSEPSAGQDGGVLASPLWRARRRLFAAVTGLALAVGLGAAGAIIGGRQPPPRPVAVLPGRGGEGPCSAAFSPGGRTLAVADCGESVSLWDIATRSRVATLTSPVCPGGGQVVFSPDGRTLALFGNPARSGNTGRYHPAACLWDVATRRETTLSDPPLLVNGFTEGAFSPGGTILAVADNSGNIYLWNLAARRVTATVPVLSYGCPCPMAFSPDGTLLAVGQITGPNGDHGHVYLWDLAARRWAGALTDPGSGSIGISSLAFGRHGILAAGVADHVYLWDVPARRLAATIAPPINAAAGNASISKGPKDGGPYPCAGCFDPTTMVAFSPDGATLAIDASFGYGTYLYHAATRNRIATLPYPAGQNHYATGVTFSPDGTMLAVDDTDHGHLSLWDVKKKRN